MPNLEVLGASYNRFASFKELPDAPFLKNLDLRSVHVYLCEIVD